MNTVPFLIRQGSTMRYMAKMNKTVLVICDDFWHPAQVPKDGLSPLKEHGFIFDWIEDARDWSASLMASYPLVILTKSNDVSSSDPSGWMTVEAQMAFAGYVRKGHGLFAIHSGTAGYQDALVLRNLLGGVFDHHPEQCEIRMEPQAGHPLTKGVESFTVKDEHYFMSMQDPYADVFLTSRSEHGEQPAGWKREIGKGRVAVLTPGHNIDVWLNPNIQTLLLSTMDWCSGAI